MSSAPRSTSPGVGHLDVEQFHRTGWCLVPDVFTAEECDVITTHVEAAAFRLDLGRREDGQMVYRPMMHLSDPFLASVCTDPRWAPIVVPLVGPDVRLYWEQCVAKPPGTGTELPWHQDNGYTPLIPEAYLTCWLALDDADEDNGGLRLLPASHTSGTRPHRDDVDGNPYFRVGSEAGPADGIAVTVPKGSVLVFSSLILHRSGPNHTTDRERRAWIIQFCPADARSALSNKPLDDRLRVAADGRWLDEPVRDREIDLVAMLANYQSGQRSSR